MTKSNNKFSSFVAQDNGFSLTELLIVIIIIIIASTLAIMNIGSSKSQLSRQNVAIELKNAFERARFDSVKRRAEGGARANVFIASTGTSFTLNTDINQDGAISGEGRINANWATGITIRAEDGTALGSDVTMTFDKRGEVTSSGASVFLICNDDCSASNSNKILVTATGTVNLLSGAAPVPTFSPPPVTTPSVVINSDTVLPIP